MDIIEAHSTFKRFGDCNDRSEVDDVIDELLSSCTNETEREEFKILFQELFYDFLQRSVMVDIQKFDVICYALQRLESYFDANALQLMLEYINLEIKRGKDDVTYNAQNARDALQEWIDDNEMSAEQVVMQTARLWFKQMVDGQTTSSTREKIMKNVPLCLTEYISLKDRDELIGSELKDVFMDELEDAFDTQPRENLLFEVIGQLQYILTVDVVEIISKELKYRSTSRHKSRNPYWKRTYNRFENARNVVCMAKDDKWTQNFNQWIKNLYKRFDERKRDFWANGFMASNREFLIWSVMRENSDNAPNLYRLERIKLFRAVHFCIGQAAVKLPGSVNIPDMADIDSLFASFKRLIKELQETLEHLERGITCNDLKDPEINSWFNRLQNLEKDIMEDNDDENPKDKLDPFTWWRVFARAPRNWIRDPEDEVKQQYDWINSLNSILYTGWTWMAWMGGFASEIPEQDLQEAHMNHISSQGKTGIFVADNLFEYSQRCIKKWLKTTPRCPICRKWIEDSDNEERKEE